jgi:hypothetical protein
MSTTKVTKESIFVAIILHLSHGPWQLVGLIQQDNIIKMQ